MSAKNLKPESWTSKRLKYVSTYNDEVLSEKTDEEREIDYVEISGVSLSEGIKEISRMTFAQAPSRARRVVRSGDVLISTVRTYLKAIAKVDDASEDLIASTGFCVVRPSEKVDSSFLGWAAKSEQFVEEVVARSVGVSYPAINASELVKIEVPLPPLDTQRRIAAFLDEKTARIDGLIAKKRELLERLAEKRQALITQAVTKGINPHAPMKPSGIDWLGDIPAHWEVKRLQFLTSKIGSGVTPRGGAEAYVNEGIMLLRSQNIQNEGLSLGDVVFIDEETHSNMMRTQVISNDVLLNITGASIGRCCHYNLEGIEANVNQHVCIIRPCKFESARFITSFLQADPGQSQIFLSQVGASREGLSFSEIGDFTLALPPIEEQTAIADYISDAFNQYIRQTEDIDKSIALLTEYRSALITGAVTGQIDLPALDEQGQTGMKGGIV